MTDYRIIRRAADQQIILNRVRWCQSSWCHFRGLQFASEPIDGEGLLFVYNSESITKTAIHMFFVFFDIAVVWLDSSGKVVDKKLAKPWRPFYAPAQPAQYFIEANPTLLNRVQVGDVLTFDEVVT